MIDPGLHTVGVAAVHAVGVDHPPFEIKIVCDKLVFAKIRFDDLPLPHQEVCCDRAQIPFKFGPKAPVDGPPYIRDIFPGINAIAPVVQTESTVAGFGAVVEFLFQITDESLLNTWIDPSCGLCSGKKNWD